MGTKDLRRSGPNTGRRHMAYSNDKRNAYDNTKSKLRYEILCCLYFVLILCCGFLSGFAIQIWRMLKSKAFLNSKLLDYLMLSFAIKTMSDDQILFDILFVCGSGCIK